MKKLLAILMVVFCANANAKTVYSTITLDNGLQAYLIEDHRQPIAINMLWYNVGSGDEVAGKSGIAHLLEHLMFKGTEKIKPQEFSKIIAKLGGVDNASTSADYTNYFELINTKNLGTAMAMEADRMENLRLSEQDFKTELKVVTQERHQRIDNSPWGRFYEKIMDTLYETLPYRILTTGTVEDLKHLTREDALNWYKSYYAPNNAKLIVIGDLTPAKFEKLVRENYSNLKAENFKHSTWDIEQLYLKPKRLDIADKQVKSSNYFKIFRVPSAFAGIAGMGYNKSDMYNLMVLDNLLAGSKSSYLYEKLVLEQQIATSVSADYSPISKAETTFDITLQIKDGISKRNAEKTLKDSIASFITDFNNENKIQAAKIEIKASQIYLKDDAIRYARSIGKFISAGGTIEQYDQFFTNIDNVTLTSLKQTAKHYLESKQYLDAWLTPAE